MELQLTKEEKEKAVKLFLHGMTQKKVAEKYGVPTSTIRKAVNEARKEVIAKIKNH